MDQILIDILTSLPGIFIAAAVAYFFSQRKYTFEKLHDKKLLYLEEIYSQIVSIEKDLNKYVLTTGSMMQSDYLEKRKAELGPIQSKFFELQEYFWKKEIILNESSIIAIQSFIDCSVEILSKLKVSNLTLEMGGSEATFDLWKNSYEIMEERLGKAKMELKNDFRGILES